MCTPTDDFKLVTDGTHFIVRLGRALRKDEYRCKLFQLELDEEEVGKEHDMIQCLQLCFYKLL